MGGDGPGVAWLISVGTLAAMVTLSLWISQFGEETEPQMYADELK